MHTDAHRWLSPLRGSRPTLSIAARDADASAVRLRLSAGLRRSPFCEQARSTEPCLPLGVRLGLGTRVPGTRMCSSGCEGLLRLQSEPSDRGLCLRRRRKRACRAGSDEGLPWRHCLQGTAKPWIPTAELRRGQPRKPASASVCICVHRWFKEGLPIFLFRD
jgi:hypothetical protein